MARGLVFFALIMITGCAGRSHAVTKSPHGLSQPDSLTETPAEKTPHATSGSSESPYQDITQITPGQIIHLRTGLSMTEESVMAHLSEARIVYAGEVHDSLEDHRVQLKILKGLVARFPGKVVVGMEMFQRSSQDLMDQWIRGEADDKAFLKRWYEDWSHDDAYYRELLDFIKAQKIPVIALRPTAEMSFKMRAKGMDGLSENDRRKLPEIDTSDPYHRAAVNAIFQGHGPGASNQFDSFYEMMLFWEETMAETIADYLVSPEGRDKKMMVMAGGFHVGYGFGIPRRTFRRLPMPYQIVISHAQDFPDEMKMLNVTPPNLPLPLADFVWGVAYRPLEKKKVRLGVMLEQFQAGVRISDVFPESPADKAGIERGDIITTFDGQAVHERFDIIFRLQQKKPGDRVKIKILRNGKSIETEAVMAVSGHP